MREAINNNPVVQAALVGALLIVGVFFFISTTGGGEGESASTPETEALVTVAGSGATGTATGANPGEAVEGAIADATGGSGEATPTTIPAPMDVPPPPAPVLAAFDSGKTVVLLFVRKGGIDDRITRTAVKGLRSVPDVARFVIPAGQIARYASITRGVAVDRVPALVVIRPKDLDGGVPVASVQYGFQSPQSVSQAVIDAGYQGRTLEYHP